MLSLTRLTLISLLMLLSFSATTPAQSNTASQPSPMPSDADPSFDVAVIKPSDTSVPRGMGIRNNGRHIAAFNFPLGELIAFSYGLHQKQIINGASPIFETHFDIDGVPDIAGHPNLAQSRLMFQKLLISRFKLAFHYESRVLPAYAIQLANNGPKLIRTTRKPGDSTGFSYNCQIVLTVRNASLTDVAKGMQEAFLDKPVVDQTGLQDRYDFELKWLPDESQSYCPVDATHAHSNPDTPTSIYTAMQEQLGLKLVPTKTSIQVMVIDHIETPSEN
ncbi:TIGR03435 family protein [Terriglobus roseus]|uniref:Soil-associated protein, TIGR03435 family n=1 Tax=Terriglobus roseus TaxID=392734 RepID=A0A1G7IFT8_9BACT|nr:TIGR03435 family protein [Terriglobus roseus]SDF11169.1 soil-associated protein, TIGR03435 family [Terriglobus roseus]